MRIGVPREAKPGERRVGLVPAGARALVAAGHEVRVEAGAGTGSGHDDADYVAAGASLVPGDVAWDAELAIKVKELQPGEAQRLPEGAALFSFQHLAGHPALTREIAARGLTAIAFETVRTADGGFPLLAPMSAIAGRMAVEVGTRYLGHSPRRVLVLGAGHAGRAAALAAAALGAEVTVLRRHDATPANVERAALAADLVVGAVFIPAAPTPKLLPRTLVRRMRPGSVLVDVSIDAGGVAETSRPTSHADPVYTEEGVIHYAVANMPAADAPAATSALARATLPYLLALAGKGIARAVADDAALREGVLVWQGRVVHPGLAAEAGLPWEALAA